MKIMIRPLSKNDLNKILRKGKAYELLSGGVWYYKDKTGCFHRVVNENVDDGFRSFCAMCSKFGYMYLFRDKPNFSYTKEAHIFDNERIKKYLENEPRNN